MVIAVRSRAAARCSRATWRSNIGRSHSPASELTLSYSRGHSYERERSLDNQTGDFLGAQPPSVGDLKWLSSGGRNYHPYCTSEAIESAFSLQIFPTCDSLPAVRLDPPRLIGLQL